MNPLNYLFFSPLTDPLCRSDLPVAKLSQAGACSYRRHERKKEEFPDVKNKTASATGKISLSGFEFHTKKTSTTHFLLEAFSAIEK